ncbi:MAG: hypothetical protein ACI4XL_11265 [Bacillus sp. (in: firmicutes)]
MKKSKWFDSYAMSLLAGSAAVMTLSKEAGALFFAMTVMTLLCRSIVSSKANRFFNTKLKTSNDNPS